MWITLLDKDREYVINFKNVIGFTKIMNCKHDPCIELFMSQAGITLWYDSHEERDSTYDLLIKKLGSIEI